MFWLRARTRADRRLGFVSADDVRCVSLGRDCCSVVGSAEFNAVGLVCAVGAFNALVGLAVDGAVRASPGLCCPTAPAILGLVPMPVDAGAEFGGGLCCSQKLTSTSSVVSDTPTAVK